jgi:hypothetical protein
MHECMAEHLMEDGVEGEVSTPALEHASVRCPDLADLSGSATAIGTCHGHGRLDEKAQAEQLRQQQKETPQPRAWRALFGTRQRRRSDLDPGQVPTQSGSALHPTLDRAFSTYAPLCTSRLDVSQSLLEVTNVLI